MQQRRVKFGLLAVASAVGALMLTGGSALAGSQATSAKTTGPEVISGAVHGKAATRNAPKIPLKLRGLVSAHAVIGLGSSKSKKHILKTTAGNLTVIGTSKHQTHSANKATCQYKFAQLITLRIDGSASTGAFAGASGPGAAKVSFAGVEPRFSSGPKKGTCDGNARARSKGAVANFLLTMVLTQK